MPAVGEVACGACLQAAHDGEAADKLRDEAKVDEVHVLCPLQRVIRQRLRPRAALYPRAHLRKAECCQHHQTCNVAARS